MSWTDKTAVKTILQLRDEFKITDFVETGTFRGVNAKLHSNYFKNVITCEYNEDYFNVLERKLPDNVQIHLSDSPSFLYMYRWRYLLDPTLPPPFFYLDAHFYLPEMKEESNEKKFVILRELKALSGFGNCIIAIHDFDFDCVGLGHITYDSVSLNFDLVKESLIKVNPNFKFYTNSREFCDIITSEEVIAGKVKGIEATEDVLDNLKYVWSSPEKTYRGILYCIPKELDLSKYELKELI